MTCIAAIIEGDVIHMAADSITISGSDKDIRADEKIIKKGQYIIGMTGSFRMDDIIRYYVELPEIAKKENDVRRHMVLKVVPAIKKALLDHGAMKTESGIEKSEPGAILIGYKGRLFTIYSDFQVEELNSRYSACGSGEDYAKGAIYACIASLERLSPKRILTTAIKAAANHCSSVSLPVSYGFMKSE